MENLNLRDRYEFVLGFVAVAISLAAFKDELSRVTIDLGFVQFTLAQYFLAVIIGFLFCIYIYAIVYVVDNALSTTSPMVQKVFRFAIRSAYVLFGVFLLSPLIVLAMYLSFQILSAFEGRSREIVNWVGNAIVTFLVAMLANLIATTYLRRRKERTQRELEDREIVDLETATRLHRDGYYSQAIVEAFKVLELHLYRLLTQQDVSVQRHRLNDLLKLARSRQILTKQDLAIIDEVRQMRNAAAHLNVEHNKEQATRTMGFIRDLVSRTSPTADVAD